MYIFGSKFIIQYNKILHLAQQYGFVDENKALNTKQVYVSKTHALNFF